MTEIQGDLAVKIRSTKKLLCMSVIPLITQVAIAATPATNSHQTGSKQRNALPHQQVTKPYRPTSIRMLEERIRVLEHKQKTEAKNKVIDPVLALPQVNLREKYDTAPTYNNDLALLQMRERYYKQLIRRHIEPIPYPRIELGGSIIGLGSYRKPANIPPRNGRPQSDINLSGANLNVTSEIMSALMGALRISYNPNGAERLDETTITTRVANSSIFLNTAFLTLGDLNRLPFYLSVGQMFLPFGEYGSSLMAAPLTARLGRFRQRPILLGFQQPGSGFNASIFAFSGDTYVGPNSSTVNNSGANIGYGFNSKIITFNTGVSYIHNIADSGGMQNTGASAIVTDAGEFVDNDFVELDDGGPLIAFRGFGAFPQLVNNVPAYNARARIGIVPLHLSFYGEFVRPTTAFDVENLSFNDFGARPSAWNAEGTFKFNIVQMQSSITVGYGKSAQALALNLPNSSWGISFRIKPHKYISCGMGFTFDKAYPLDTDATGQGLTVPGLKFLGTNTKTLNAQVNARF